MEPYTYKQVLVTTAVTASRLVQAHKILKEILKRLKLWVSSVFHARILVYPHLEVQDASSGGSIESTRSTPDPLMTHDSITCQPTSGENLVPLPPSEPPPSRHCHVQNDGNKYRDEEIPEDAFLLELAAPENDQYHLSNASEQPELCRDSATVLSWPSDTPPPPVIMWHQSAETVEAFDSIDEVRTEDPKLSVDMLCDVPSRDQLNLSYSCPSVRCQRDSIQDIQDTGLCIIITPPDDYWETSWYSAYNNRIGFQYLGCLVVPQFYQFTSRLIKYEEWTALHHPPAGTVSYDQPVATTCSTSDPTLVFSLSGFQKHLQDTKNDRFNFSYVVTALQRHRLKAAAFTASLKACFFRMRYDTPGFLENIEPRFKWIDPAEILIESFRHTPQRVTIYVSHRPCSVPHIAIHESLPNDPYVVWSNSTDTQSYCFLARSSPNPLLWEKDDYQMADDCLTDASSSLCDSSAPGTPKDFSCTFDQDLGILLIENTYETQYRDDICQQYEDQFAVPQYSGPQSTSSKLFVLDDEEEDSLPPLDDWYIAIANRCMPPEEAEAVGAAAAVMSLSCH